MSKKTDEKLMAKALELAKKAKGITGPDPMVGAVVAKNNKIISIGYHGQYTTAHAETWALRKAKEKAKGATLYVNLEPCSHFGNNPPCVDFIISSGIKRVVAGMTDPNPLVKGKGFKMLQKAGVKVTVGVLEKESKELNQAFIKYITTKTPFVTVKAAMSLDGKIALSNGESKWISGKTARTFSHKLRNNAAAILIGTNTALKDNPSLDVRFVPKDKKDAIRIVLDSKLRVPTSIKALDIKIAPSMIVTSKNAPKAKVKKLLKKGIEVIQVNTLKGKLDLKELMKKLGEKKIASVLIEGGGNTIASAIEAGIVDKVIFMIAPKILGGKDSLSPVEGEGVSSIAKAYKIKNLKVSMVGEDMVAEGYF